jgi:hypothetical protein
MHDQQTNRSKSRASSAVKTARVFDRAIYVDGIRLETVLSLSAIRTRSANDLACILRMTWARWTLTVISLT